MKVLEGDLFKFAEAGLFDLVVHGCNCFHTMGSGIAKQVREQYPQALEADLYFGDRGDIEKLGKFSVAPAGKFFIIDAYTQFEPGPNYNYGAIEKAFTNIKAVYGGKGFRFGIPKIGAGVAGGDWEVISTIIEKAMEGEDLTLIVYKP